MLLVLIAALIVGVVVLVAVASALDEHDEAVRRQQLAHRVYRAKQEIEAIGRETQAAILAEAQRRARDGR